MMNAIIKLLKIINPSENMKSIESSYFFIKNKEYLLSSKQRLNKIKQSLLFRDQHSESSLWECVRVELNYLNRQIKKNPKFNLSKYLKKNYFMGNLIQTQIYADSLIEDVLNKKPKKKSIF